jgi:hypothetical protein
VERQLVHAVQGHQRSHRDEGPVAGGEPGRSQTSPNRTRSV